MIRKITLTCLLAVLAACSNQVSNSVKINKKSDEALVLVGMDFSGQSDPRFHFNRYDPVTGKVLKGSVDVKASTEAYSKSKKAFAFFSDVTPDGSEVMAFKVPPGSWFLEGTTSSQNTGYMQTTMFNNAFSKGTIAFDVKPGEVLYLGHFSLNYGLHRMAPNLPEAEDKVNSMRNVEAKPVMAKIKLVTFTCGQAHSLIGLKVPGCKPLVVSPQ